MSGITSGKISFINTLLSAAAPWRKQYRTPCFSLILRYIIASARGVRNLFEHILVAQNNRLAAMENVTREDLTVITADDVLRARGKVD